jgi:predicted HTH domain antitoxin
MGEKLTTIRLNMNIDKEIERLARAQGTDKSKLIRDLIIFGIKEKKLQEALYLYSKGKISMWKGARMAGLSLWQMMEIIAERKIPMPYGIKELEEDLKGLK